MDWKPRNESKMENKAFHSRSGMKFDGSITTDGTSVSVYLKHPDADMYDKPVRKSKETLKAELDTLYFEENLPALAKPRRLL
jgi:hypothetical protein